MKNMIRPVALLLPVVTILSCSSLKESPAVSAGCDSARWKITGQHEITWDVAGSNSKGHYDHIEMSGRRVSAIITYGTDSSGNFSVKREVIWPLLRTVNNGKDKSWMAYRAYLKRRYSDDNLPSVFLNGKPVRLNRAVSVKLSGVMSVSNILGDSIVLTRTFIPSSARSFLVERWSLENTGKDPVRISVSDSMATESETGFYGMYIIQIRHDQPTAPVIEPGKTVTLGIYFTARKESEDLICDAEMESGLRQSFLTEIGSSLQLVTPDSVLNTEFFFSKVRTSESIFDTKRGLMHSPGGGRYYAGVWANDQVEYAGPFFPFLGYKPAIEASANAYRIFAGDMKPDYTPIWSSHEIEGDLTCCGSDRGDAAMYLYGAARFLLAQGDKKLATELLPAIKWAAEYNRRKINHDGVIASQTDEMEGRIATGDANLSTSAIAYGGFLSASDLLKTLNENQDLQHRYDSLASELKKAIENYFGADIDGFHTYRYFKGHSKLRHWICLPLTMGITDRSEGTISALFDKLWTKEGLLVETGENMFWDRGTLYALRGVFNAGATDRALEKLEEYSCQRLLGEHVPYPVEAWPEGDQAHLAAESALYCRIYTEGMFGIVPKGFRSFECTPRLPSGWDKMELRHIRAFGEDFNILVAREKQKLRVTVRSQTKTYFSGTKGEGEKFKIEL